MDRTERNLIDSLHLSKYQAKLYIAGLNFSHATLSDLAKSAGIPRTAAYQPLKGLLERSIMTSIKKGKREYYTSIDPKQLIHVVEQDRARLDIAVKDLAQRIDSKQEDLSIRYFTGTHGVQAAADLFLNKCNTKLWHAVEHPISVLEKIDESEFEAFIKRRVEKDVHVRVIIPSDSLNPWVKKRVERAKEELYDILVVSDEEYPIKSSMVVGGEFVLIFNTKGIPFAILIQNPDIATTFKSMHDMIWDRYRR